MEKELQGHKTQSQKWLEGQKILEALFTSYGIIPKSYDHNFEVDIALHRGKSPLSAFFSLPQKSPTSAVENVRMSLAKSGREGKQGRKEEKEDRLPLYLNLDGSFTRHQIGE